VRVLVTGATGYVGSALVRRLLAAGHEPVALVRDGDARLPDGVAVRVGDVLDPPSLRAAAHGAGGAVHLAALTRVRESGGDAGRYRAVNVDGTAAVLDALEATGAPDGPPRLVFASSAAVYGAATQRPIPETAPAAPRGPYAETKLAAERLIAGRAGRGAVAAVVLRVFNVAGALDGHGDTDPTRLIPRVLAVAAGLAPRLEIYGDGTAVRDYVHVGDVADAMVAALAAARPGTPPVYNVGGTPAAVLDLVAAAERVTGRPVAVVHRPGNPGEAPDLRADTTAIRAALAWRPVRSALDDLLAGQWAATAGPNRPGSARGPQAAGGR
jgi:UDP-glucose 4-epimerase